jgi:predicted RNase H-like HicB family nuclease
LDYYLHLSYKLVIVPEEAGGFFAKIEELPGCMTQGETMEEVLRNIDDAKHLWLQTALEDKMEIPLPECMREYSGRFVVRIPASLHRRIAALANKEGVSLNQMVLSLLTENTAAAEITTAVRAVVRETRKQMDEMYRIENPLMVGEPGGKPYSVSFTKGTWEA